MHRGYCLRCVKRWLCTKQHWRHSGRCRETGDKDNVCPSNGLQGNDFKLCHYYNVVNQLDNNDNLLDTTNHPNLHPKDRRLCYSTRTSIVTMDSKGVNLTKGNRIRNEDVALTEKSGQHWNSSEIESLQILSFRGNSLDREGVEFVSRSLKATQSFGSFYSMVIILRMKLTSVGSAAQ